MTLQIESLAVSTVNASVTLTPAAVKVVIKNIGTQAAFFQLNGAATTANFQLDANDEILIGLQTVATVQAITSSGTTTLAIAHTEEY